MPTTKEEFQELSLVRLEESKALLAAGLYDGAFYLAGYSVECALKAIYCKRFRKEELPEQATVKSAYTHDLDSLVASCEISGELQPNGSPRQTNWAIVKSWKETSRYQRRTQQEAFDIIGAIDDPTDGILIWLQSKW